VTPFGMGMGLEPIRDSFATTWSAVRLRQPLLNAAARISVAAAACHSLPTLLSSASYRPIESETRKLFPKAMDGANEVAGGQSQVQQLLLHITQWEGSQKQLQHPHLPVHRTLMPFKKPQATLVATWPSTYIPRSRADHHHCSYLIRSIVER
jgi:hypothetical protein